MKNGTPPLLTGERGREVLRFALAAIESARENRAVELDAYGDKPLPKRKGFLSIFRLGKK